MYQRLPILLLVFHFKCNFAAFTKTFEFENAVGGPGQTRSPWRSEASGSSALHLFKGDAIRIDLCLPEPARITLDDLLYSNDGNNDTVRFTMDSVPLDTILTAGKPGGWGLHWNSFKSTGKIPRATKLSAGRHSLVMTLEDGDCYGTEFDALLIGLDIDLNSEVLLCGSDVVYAADPSPCAVDFDTQDKAWGKLIRRKGNDPTISTQTSAPSTSEWNRFQTEVALPGTAPADKPVSAPSVLQDMATTSNQGNNTPTTTTPNLQELTSTILAISNVSDSDNFLLTTSYPSGASRNVENFIPTTSISEVLVHLLSTSTTSDTGIATESTLKGFTGTEPLPSPNNTTLQRDLLTNTSSENGNASDMGSNTLKTTVKSTPFFVEQHSYPSRCLDSTNVDIRFNVRTLKNIQITARELRKTTNNNGKNVSNVGLKCETNIWQIGQKDGSNRELGQILPRGNTFDFDVNANTGQREEFPKSINTATIKKVYLRYIIPARFNIRRGRVRFSLGLTGVTSNMTVGLSYFNRAKRNPSAVEYRRATPKKMVMQWNIPARAISPSLSNIIQLHFQGAPGVLANFDFLGMEYLKAVQQTQKKVLQTSAKWKITGVAYKHKKNTKSLPSGMHIFINGEKQNGVFAKATIYRKPNAEVFSVNDNGELYIRHKQRSRKGSKNEQKSPKQIQGLDEVSGFTIGSTERRIAKVDILPKMSEATWTYNDGHFVKCVFSYSKTRSKVVIVDTSFSDATVKFFSTYLNSDVAAVNTVSVNGGERYHIMSKGFQGRRRKVYTFTRSSTSPMFRANDETQIVFPAL